MWICFRRVTLFEELQLLKEFEKRENVLAAKVEGKIKERSDSQLKVSFSQTARQQQILVRGQKISHFIFGGRFVEL